MPSDFKPRADGDYSHWEELFDKKIAAACSDPNSFVNNVNLFGDQAAESFFEKFSSSAGVARLASAVEHHAVGSYIGSKGGLIVFWVFAILILIGTITLAFALMKSCRRVYQRYTCKDRPRQQPEEKKSLGTLILIALTFLGLFALSVCLWVYSAKLLNGKASVACDTWQGLKGHYFGHGGVVSPAGVVREWSGSQAQRKNMKSLADMVDPTPKDGGVCMLCRDVIQAYNGTDETSLVNTLQKTALHTMSAINKGIVARQVFTSLMQQLQPTRYDMSDPIFNGETLTHKTGSEWKSPYDDLLTLNLQVLSAGLKLYETELGATLERGLKMFSHNIDTTLGRDSPVLKTSHATALTSLTALADIDYVVAGIVDLFDHTEPLMSGGLTALAVISILFGVLMVGAIGLGGFLVVKARKARKEKASVSPKIVKTMGGLYAVLIISSGVAFVLAALFFTIGQVGSDACGLIDQVAFQDGNWAVLPPKMWNKTVSGQTDVRTVLNTCITDHGDGDVAASLGLRMSLDRLSQSVSGLEKNLMQALDEGLNINAKRKKANVLGAMARAAPRTLAGNWITKSFAPAFNQHTTKEVGDVRSSIKLVSPMVGESSSSVVCIIPGFLAKDITAVASIFMLFCTSGLALEYSPTNLVLDDLNAVVARAKQRDPTLPFSRFCFRHQAEQGACSMDGGEVYIVDTSRQTNGALKTNPFLDPPMLQFLKTLKDPEDVKDLQSAISALTSFINNDGLHVRIGDSADDPIPAELEIQWVNVTQWLPEAAIKPDHDKIDVKSAVEILYPSMKGKDCLTAAADSSKDDPDCSFMSLLKGHYETSESVADAIVNGFETTASSILNFVQDKTLGSFKAPLVAADGSLADFNCQYVGTSVKEGAKSGICNVVMPSVASLGLVYILLWVICSVGGFLSWKVYHYYSDLLHFGGKFDSVVLAKADSSLTPTEKVKKLLSS